MPMQKNGRPLKTAIVGLDPGVLLAASAELDYVLCGTEGTPGERWGTIRLENEQELEDGDDVFIIGHPNGGPKCIALAENTVIELHPPRFRYTADTELGSSGSPILDRHARLIGIHRAAGHYPPPDEEKLFNEGLLSSAILADIGADAKKMLSKPRRR